MSQYETHKHSDPDFPIIFHIDTVCPNNCFYSHWHEGIEILYCTQGNGEIIIDSEVYTMNAGEMFIINSGCLHTVNCLSEEKLRYYCLIPSESFCESFGFKISEIRYAPKIQDDYFRNIFNTIDKEYDEKQAYYKTKIKAEILGMLVYLSRNYAVRITEDSVCSSKKQMVKDAIKYIKNNYGERMQIEDIAKKVGFSRYYFCHSFKEMTGISVVNYINMVRCENAKTHIFSKKYNISEIALMCGFDNFSYFTKTYKKYMGILPSDELKSK